MASQTDKKEEFRKYLEKGKVLAVLTTVLTDLFEMENKPEDPLQYLHQRFGENVNKSPPINGPQKDVAMSDVAKKTYTPPADQEMIPAQPPTTAPAVANHNPTPTVPAEQPAAPTQSSVPAQTSAPSAQVAQPQTQAVPAQPTPTDPTVASRSGPIPAPVPASNPAVSSSVPTPAAHTPVTGSQAPVPADSTALPSQPAATAPAAPTQPQAPAAQAPTTAPAVAQNPAPVQ